MMFPAKTLSLGLITIQLETYKYNNFKMLEGESYLMSQIVIYYL